MYVEKLTGTVGKRLFGTTKGLIVALSALFLLPLISINSASAMPIQPFQVDYTFSEDPDLGFLFIFAAGAQDETRLLTTGTLNATLLVNADGSTQFSYSGMLNAELIPTGGGPTIETGFVNVSGQFNNVVGFDSVNGIQPNELPQPDQFATLDAGTHSLNTNIQFLVVNGFENTFLSFMPAIDGLFQGATSVLNDGDLKGWFTTGFGRGDLHGSLVSMTVTQLPPAEVPEPLSVLLLGAGLLGGAAARKKAN